LKRPRNLTAGEVLAHLEQDPAYLKREIERERRWEVNSQRYDAAAASLIQELKAVGYDVEAVGELRMRRDKYTTAIPVLLHWLPRVEYAPLKDDIIRSLSAAWAKQARPFLLELFRTTADDSGDAGRWVIGNALEPMADDSVFDEYAAICRDKRYGSGRQMVVLGLGRMKRRRVEAVGVLMELLESDEQVYYTAIEALGKLRAKEATTLIERFLNHTDPDWRNQAKRALAKMNRDVRPD